MLKYERLIDGDLCNERKNPLKPNNSHGDPLACSLHKRHCGGVGPCVDTTTQRTNICPPVIEDFRVAIGCCGNKNDGDSRRVVCCVPLPLSHTPPPLLWCSWLSPMWHRINKRKWLFRSGEYPLSGDGLCWFDTHKPFYAALRPLLRTLQSGYHPIKLAQFPISLSASITSSDLFDSIMNWRNLNFPSTVREFREHRT